MVCNMIEGLFLATQGFYGGAFGNVLATWEQVGIFSYVLPFLIIFSLVFGILSRVNLFKDNRTINAILALSVGLLSLQFDFVPIFFSEIFPRVGIGLAVILVVLIFTMLFSNPDDRWQMYLLWGIGMVTVIVILLQTSWATGFGYSSYWGFLGYYWQEIFAIGAIAVIIVAIIISARSPNQNAYNSAIAQSIRTSMGQPAIQGKPGA